MVRGVVLCGRSVAYIGVVIIRVDDRFGGTVFLCRLWRRFGCGGEERGREGE